MTWPVTLTDGDLELRPLRQRDRRAWNRLRRENIAWLKEWDATLPPEGEPGRELPVSFGAMIGVLRQEARSGRALPWAVVFRGDLIGQLTVAGIALGSLRSGSLGYWLSHSHAGRGLMPRAVAMAGDYCIDGLGLHRIEVNIRPENRASLRVVEKLGLRCEGLRERYLHINGEWRDHLTYVYLAGDALNGLAARLRDTPNTSAVTSATPVQHGGSVAFRDRVDLRGDHRPVGSGSDPDLVTPPRSDQ